MATPKRCCNGSKRTCSHLKHQASLETQTAIYLENMVHCKPKSSPQRSHSSRTIDEVSTDITRISLKSRNTDHLKDKEKTRPHRPKRGGIHSMAGARLSKSQTSHVESDQMHNGHFESEDGTTFLHNGNDYFECPKSDLGFESDKHEENVDCRWDKDSFDRDGRGIKRFLKNHFPTKLFLKSHQHRELDQSDNDLNNGMKDSSSEDAHSGFCQLTRSPPSGHFMRSHQQHEEDDSHYLGLHQRSNHGNGCNGAVDDGEDEHDGIISDFFVHTKHRVKGFFGKHFFRFHKERPDETVADSSETHILFVPSPFQTGFECLGVHIRREMRGLRVTRVLNDSLACKAHLMESDIMTHLNDEELIDRELDEIRSLFAGVQKTFHLTVWREIQDGNKTQYTELTIKISITETANRSFEIEVYVRRAGFIPSHQSSGCQYVTQDPDYGHQVYMHYDVDGSLYMREHEDDSGSKVSFYFDFYRRRTLRRGRIIGQHCTIRHTTDDGDVIFNCETGRMESVPTPLRNVDRYIFLRTSVGSSSDRYRYRAFVLNDRYLTNVDGKIQLCSLGAASSPALSIFETFSC